MIAFWGIVGDFKIRFVSNHSSKIVVGGPTWLAVGTGCWPGSWPLSTRHASCTGLLQRPHVGHGTAPVIATTWEQDGHWGVFNNPACKSTLLSLSLRQWQQSAHVQGKGTHFQLLIEVFQRHTVGIGLWPKQYTALQNIEYTDVSGWTMKSHYVPIKLTQRRIPLIIQQNSHGVLFQYPKLLQTFSK